MISAILVVMNNKIRLLTCLSAVALAVGLVTGCASDNYQKGAGTATALTASVDYNMSAIAGVVIGPSGLGLVSNVGQIADVAELGVVMLLFLIGLELRPHRLWILRKAVFGMGLGQMVPTALLIAMFAHVAGLPWTGAALLGTAMLGLSVVLMLLIGRLSRGGSIHAA